MFPMTADVQFAVMLTACALVSLAVTAFALRSQWNSRRGLFLYWDGHRMRAISPITVVMRLDRLGAEGQFRLYHTPRLAAAGNRKALAEVGCVVTEVFELPPPSKSGLSNRDCLQLLTNFMRYVDEQKRTARKSVA